VPSLRLLSVNARAVGGGRDARDARDALVSLVGEQDADLVVVHGAPQLLRWRQAVGAIARRSGLVVVAGGGRQAGGVLLLSSLGVDSGAVRSVRFTGSGGLRPAGAAVAAMRRRGREFVFAGTTLIGNSAVRLGQVRELHAAMAALTPAAPPAIVSAEGTDRPGTAAWQALVESRVAVAQRIFVDPRFDVVDARTLGGHPFTAPVVAELALG